tara:strand:- start:93 stop:320 length:228 start_codon:yes stop_codon:yes gene_type:complete
MTIKYTPEWALNQMKWFYLNNMKNFARNMMWDFERVASDWNNPHNVRGLYFDWTREDFENTARLYEEWRNKKESE